MHASRDTRTIYLETMHLELYTYYMHIEIYELYIPELCVSIGLHSIYISRYIQNICLSKSRNVCIVCMNLEMQTLGKHLDLEMHAIYVSRNYTSRDAYIIYIS